MMDGLHKKLLQKEMTRREFLQFAGASVLVLVGFGNLISLVNHFTKTAEPSGTAKTDARHGFGASKFGT